MVQINRANGMLLFAAVTPPAVILGGWYGFKRVAKSTFEGCWKALKDYYRAMGIERSSFRKSVFKHDLRSSKPYIAIACIVTAALCTIVAIRMIMEHNRRFQVTRGNHQEV